MTRLIDQWSVFGLSVPAEFIDVLHERDAEKVAQGIRKFLRAEGILFEYGIVDRPRERQCGKSDPPG